MPPSFRRRPYTEEEKLIVAQRRARFEKTRPQVITVVNLARDLGRPATDDQRHLPEAAPQLAHMAESVLNTQNRWKRGGRIYNHAITTTTQHLEGAVKVADWVVKRSMQAYFPQQWASDKACLQACRAILLAWHMLINSWDTLPTKEQLEDAIDALVHAYRFHQLLAGKERWSDEYRLKLKRRLNLA